MSLIQGISPVGSPYTTEEVILLNKKNQELEKLLELYKNQAQSLERNNQQLSTKLKEVEERSLEEINRLKTAVDHFKQNTRIRQSLLEDYEKL